MEDGNISTEISLTYQITYSRDDFEKEEGCV